MSGRHPWSQIRDRLCDPESEYRIAQYRRAMETISRLEQLREARGLTQADVAEALGGELRLVAVFPDEAVELSCQRGSSAARPN